MVEDYYEMSRDHLVHEEKVLIFVIQKKFKRVACFDSLSTRED